MFYWTAVVEAQGRGGEQEGDMVKDSPNLTHKASFNKKSRPGQLNTDFLKRNY